MPLCCRELHSTLVFCQYWCTVGLNNVGNLHCTTLFFTFHTIPSSIVVLRKSFCSWLYNMMYILMLVNCLCCECSLISYYTFLIISSDPLLHHHHHTDLSIHTPKLQLKRRSQLCFKLLYHAMNCLQMERQSKSKCYIIPCEVIRRQFRHIEQCTKTRNCDCEGICSLSLSAHWT